MISKQLDSLGPKDLFVVERIAKGQFGELYFIKDKKNN
jgi:hypothetical protein